MRTLTVGLEPLTTGFTNQVTTSGTATILYATSTQVSISSICIKAHSANTNDIYVGFISNVATTNGFVLHPHDQITFDIDARVTPIYIVSPGTAQRVSYAAIA